MDWREFRFVKKANILVWRIRQDGEKYFTEHGILNGKMQTFSDRPGSKGAEGTKAYVNAVDNAIFHMNREIRKKEECGYVEYVNGKPVKEQINKLSFDAYLPKSFCSYKPQTNISESALAKLHKEGRARYSRKYDGQMHLAVYHEWGWEIYTRRMDLTTDRFPNHIKQLERAAAFYPGTILIGEMVCLRPDGKDDFKAISRVCRSGPEDARKLVTDGEVPEPVFVIFDVLFYAGDDMQDRSYDQRSGLWRWDFPELAKRQHNQLICGVDYFNLTPDTWEDYAKKHGWEGFIITDGQAVPGDKFYSFNGKAKRPKGSHKLKPLYEEDVVIYAGLKGTGKRLGGVGSVFVKQMHPDTGQWFNCGKVGSGFTDEDLVEIENLLAKHELPVVDKDKEVADIDLSDGTGIVAMIEYSERQPGTNKFRFPVYNRVRFDKGIDECEAQRLAVEE